MTVSDLQSWLNTRGASLAVDGKPGPATRAAILKAFANTCAPAVTSTDIDAYAARLKVTPKQVRAVAKVESGGAAFDEKGRPKILFERHLFHRLTAGVHSVAPYSNPRGGGYGEDSWDKLSRAAGCDPNAAFASCSWGRFQVLGSHWRALDYASPFELAYSTVTSEAAHYELLCRYIEANGLADEMRAMTTDPETCRAFAKRYNGPSYEQFSYHTKLAKAML